MAKKYEAVIVYNADLDEAGITAQLEKVDAIIKTHNGSITATDIWGRRELSYPINNKNYGIYIVLVFEGDNTLVTDLRRQLKINESVLRSLIVNKDKFAPDFVLKRDDDPSDIRGGRDDGGMGYDGGY